jgi:hypothetical protein
MHNFWGVDLAMVPPLFHHLITKSAVKMMLFVCFVGQLDSWSPHFSDQSYASAYAS